jgi:hypothetical protein
VPTKINPPSEKGTTTKRMLRWFLISGIVGVLVALVLLGLETLNIIVPGVFLVLWPSSIVGIADPANAWDKFLFATVEFGGNFLLYGMIGSLLALCFHSVAAKS